MALRRGWMAADSFAATVRFGLTALAFERDAVQIVLAVRCLDR